jgi:predicted nuclease of predicted toxin-antitoxin system
MRLLFDQNISHRILGYLPEVFAGSQQVRTVGLENQPDAIIWEYAKKYDFSIVTFDADFYDICQLKDCPPKIVWLRTGNLTTSAIAQRMIIHQQHISAFLADPEQECLEIY